MALAMTPRRYRQIAVAALLALAAIIVTGAAVRLTDSGLGCDDWPQCSQERLIDVSSRHAAIEQVNRLFTGIVGAAVIVAVLASLWRMPRRRDLTTLSWWLVFGVLANAVIGGISVKVDLHPLAVQSHLLLSMFLIVVGTVLVHRAGEPDGARRRRLVGAVTQRWTILLFAMTWVVVFTGTLVTGAGPHAGDETADRLDVAIPTIARVHGVSVMLTLLTALGLAWRLARPPRMVSHADIRRTADCDVDRRPLRSALSTWIVVAGAQALLGYVQYLADVPAVLVGFHVAGAVVVMWAATRLVLATSATVAAAEVERAVAGTAMTGSS